MLTRNPLAGGHVEPGLRVLVLGYGREGSSAAHWLADKGASITVADSNLHETSRLSDQVVLAPEDLSLLDSADVLVVSPGIPATNPLLREAVRRGLGISSATQIFFALCPCPIVGITGSSGKSTTTALIGVMLQAANYNTTVAGNIGIPMLDMLEGLTSDSVAVLELSSFQLECLTQSPHVAVVTNLSPNHLDRHGSMQAYAEAKKQILDHQSTGDVAVLNWTDPLLRTWGEHATGEVRWFRGEKSDSTAFLSGGVVWVLTASGHEPVLPVTQIPVKGEHNVENVLAAVAAAHAMNVPADAMRSAVLGFRGLPHRLHVVARHDGITYIDDSIATSPERMAVGLRAVTGPVVLIAGGRSKHLPWDPAVAAASNHVKAIVVIGEAAGEVENAFQPANGGIPVKIAGSMSDAVGLARSLAVSGDSVLLSPGCTSYDMFKDFEERGKAFASAIEEIYGIDI